MLMEATGIDDLDELTRLAMGRPAVGTSSGASPVVRARVAQALKDHVHALAQREPRKDLTSWAKRWPPICRAREPDR